MTQTSQTSQHQADRALRKALARPAAGHDEPRLSTNFTWRTMERVQQLARRIEARRERRTLVCTIVAAVFFVAVGTAAVALFWGESVVRGFASTGTALAESMSAAAGDVCEAGSMLGVLPALAALVLPGVVVLLVADHIMRRRYRRRHDR